MYKLSPSDFAFLYEQCKLCYCLKVKEGIVQPSMPMPGVFSAINSIIQGNLVGKSLQEISKNLPEGTVVKQEGFVESKPIPNTSVYIKGKYDLLVKNKDGTYTLVDLKISRPDEEKIDKYRTQLSAYKFAMENPAKEEPIKITKMGLLIFYPERVGYKKDIAYLSFPPKWLEVKADDKGFIKFAKEIDKLLKGPIPPEDPKCRWCAYRHVGEQLTHNKNNIANDKDMPF